MLGKYISAEYLGTKRSKIAKFLNRILNSCACWTEIPKTTVLDCNGLGIVIGSGVKLGNHVTILPNTVLCCDQEKKKFPTVGDNTKIMENVTIIGAINIGRNCRIFPNQWVKKNVPDNCDLIENKIIKRGKK